VKLRSIPPIAGLFSLLLVLSCYGEDESDVARLNAELDVVAVLGEAPEEGFQRAFEPRGFSFPEDHGPHPSFRTEWWYVTGNLVGPGGEPFGFQLTLFRSALAPEGEDHPLSSWRTNQVFLGHFAVTDGDAGEFLSFERFARSSVGLAGAEDYPFRVWVEDWELRGPVGGPPAREEGEPGFREEPDGIFPLSLRASEGGVELELTLTPEKPMVLQGSEGLSQKGPEPGNASFYYSFTRLQASGTLRKNGVPIVVGGTAWMDREWSTSALSGDQVGWDWFALQLEDGFDLMVYRLRGQDGETDPLSEGLWVDPGGRSRRIPAQEVEVEVLDTWASPLDGTRYPSGWRVSIPSLDAAFRITPLIRDQEMELTFRYWEGAVRVEGTRKGEEVSGKGYVELTGYVPRGSGGARSRRIGRTGNR
jgi:predicted secreted hydrolase